MNKDELIAKMVKKRGLRAKIDANCIDCTYDPKDKGSWRKQVQNCTIFTCPLHSVRPTSKA